MSGGRACLVLLHAAAAFAALKADGSVITWGSAESGGDSSTVRDALSSGVRQVVGNAGAFAAVKTDASVVTWGEANAGGDSSEVRVRFGQRCVRGRAE